MSELQNFGKYLIKELNIDRDPNWEYLVHKYLTREKRTRVYLRGYINWSVARMFGRTGVDLRQKTKERLISEPRQVAQYAMRLCGYNNHEIAEYYGCYPGTITNNCQTVLNLYDTSKQIKEKVDRIRKKFLN